MLDKKTKQELKSKAHKLKPIIQLGNKGLSPAVLQEIERALQDHELIKIKIATIDREVKLQLFAEICAQTQAELVQVIGHMGVLFRQNLE